MTRAWSSTYPAGWRIFRYQAVSSFTSLIAYLATVDVPDPCTRTPDSVSCGQNYRLVPDSIVVTVSANGFPGFNILDGQPPGSTALVVDGLPAYVEELPPVDRPAGADASLRWTIARPGSVDNFYSIQADIRGPDVADQLQQVKALVASLHFDPAFVPLETGDAAGERAVTKALATLSATDRPGPASRASRESARCGSPRWSPDPTSPSHRSRPARPGSTRPSFSSGA